MQIEIVVKPAVPGVGRVEAGLDEFCRAHHLRVVGLLALYMGDRSVAEELAQESFSRVCEHWPKVREMARPDAWVNRVAINLANSWFRRGLAERLAHARHGPHPDRVERDDAEVIAVRDAVSRLPRRQRTVIVLRFYGGFSVRETAELMSCAEGTVKSLTHKAVAALQQRLGPIEMKDSHDD